MSLSRRWTYWFFAQKCYKKHSPLRTRKCPYPLSSTPTIHLLLNIGTIHIVVPLLKYTPVRQQVLMSLIRIELNPTHHPYSYYTPNSVKLSLYKRAPLQPYHPKIDWNLSTPLTRLENLVLDPVPCSSSVTSLHHTLARFLLLVI